MDDVGQTLLNWASAFGTLEMVGHSHLATYIVLSKANRMFLASLRFHEMSHSYLKKNKIK